MSQRARTGSFSDPAAVSGPSGLMTLADLPSPDTKRWVIRRKAQVVAGVRAGLITLDEACRRYSLSMDEFLTWQRQLEDHGLAGLRATRMTRRRNGS